jgi:hypothetical protein
MPVIRVTGESYRSEKAAKNVAENKLVRQIRGDKYRNYKLGPQMVVLYPEASGKYIAVIAQVLTPPPRKR